MFRRISSLGLGLFSCLFLGVSVLQAQTIVGSGVDRSILATGGGAEGSGFELSDVDDDLLTIGRLRSSANVVAIYSFQLPDLGAIANPFTTADLEFQFSGRSSGDAITYNADLYGIDLRETNEIANTDFFVGPGPDSRGTTMLLQENILTPDLTVARLNSVDIASYLNGLYDSGNGVGSYAYFRFSPDYDNTNIFAGTRNGYVIFSASGPAPLAPVINYTIGSPFVLGDVNRDNAVDFDDIAPFISLLANGQLQAEADIDGNGQVDFDDIAPFIELLSAP